MSLEYYITTLFRRACYENNTEVINNLLEEGVSDDEIHEGLTAACHGGHKVLALSLLALDANPNFGLEGACIGGYIDIALLMIENGADNWESGLSGACRGGNKDLVLLMIEKGAEEWDEGLASACYGGNLEIAKLMIEKGANAWSSSIKSACEGKHKELVLLMLEHGADMEDCSIPLDQEDIYLLLKKGVKLKHRSIEAYKQQEAAQQLANSILQSFLLKDLCAIISLY